MTKAENNSGRRVLDDRVILLMDEVKKVTDTGIHLPDQFTEKENYAQDTGTIVACGANAFSHLNEDEKPNIGDKCDIKRYDGVFIDKATTKDSRDYRVVNDDQILTILTI